MARTDRWAEGGRHEPKIYRIDHFVGKPDLEETSEGLPHAAMIGESIHFLEAPPPVCPHAKRSRRPTAADELTAGYGGWHGPWIES